MFFRNDDLFFTVILMFSRQVIRGVDILKHFGKIQKFYHNILEQSDHVRAGILENIIGKDFYNYVLIDGDKFFTIMERYGPDCQ